MNDNLSLDMLPNQRKKFSLPRASIYLNCAYMAPLLKSVEEAGLIGMRRKRNPLAISPEDFFSEAELLRQDFAELIHAESHQIAIIPSASYGLSTIAKNVELNRGEQIVVAGAQFPSNVYPWKRLAKEQGGSIQIVEAPETTSDRGKQWNTKLLEAINSKTKLVALGHVHWADGTRFDLEAIRVRTKEVGAYLVIDGTQSVGALPFDVKRIQPDALVCAGYKWLMGPYSIGLAYFGDAFMNGTPLEENWITREASEDFSALVNYREEYQPGARRFDVGERSNFILVPMMRAALKQINLWKPERVQEYCRKIAKPALAQLQANGFWVEDAAFRGEHLFGIRLPKGFDADAAKVRLKRANISVSWRGDAIRVSPHLYNTSEELKKFAEVLTA